MTFHSKTSVFLAKLRIQRKFSRLKLAQLSGMTLEEYTQIENCPVTTPLYILARIFNSLNISGKEFNDFQILSHEEIQQKKSKKFDQEEHEKVLINGQRTGKVNWSKKSGLRLIKNEM